MTADALCSEAVACWVRSPPSKGWSGSDIVVEETESHIPPLVPELVLVCSGGRPRLNDAAWLVRGRDVWSVARAAAVGPQAERRAGRGLFQETCHPWSSPYCTHSPARTGAEAAGAPWS